MSKEKKTTQNKPGYGKREEIEKKQLTGLYTECGLKKKFQQNTQRKKS